MRTDDTTPQQFDGTALTEEEQKLVDAGLDENAEDATPASATPAAATPEAVTPEAVETPAEAVVPAPLAVPEAPAAPKDFEAEAAALEKQYEDGDLTMVELNREMRKLTLEEVDHKNAMAAWERDKAAIEAQNAAQVQSAEDVANNAWKKAATAFEANHADFLSSKVNHALMQDAINTVESAGVQMGHAELLEEAFKIAARKAGYTLPPDPKDGSKPSREQVGEALQGRGGKPVQGLGDMPNAHVESVRGNADFASLDALPIPELEVALANMKPAEVERYLRDAPGATANGRD